MKFTLGYQVLAAVLLGILAGLFFGPYCSVLKPVGMAFTMLVQMAVLPYLCFSLIHGLGSMTLQTGKQLFRCSWPFLLLIWGIVYILIFLLRYLIPSPTTALITEKGGEGIGQNFLNYIIPQNPFYDFANNILPAVVIFSLILGIALMVLEKKEPLCEFLNETIHAIERIFHWLAVISPIGAFAHIAYATGTVRFEDLYKLEFYIIAFIIAALFVTFWILPLLLSSMTPLTYREAISAYKSVCLLPFVTGIPTLSLPFLFEYLRTNPKNIEKQEETSQAILPMAFGFGEIGNCMLLFFIFFIAFYYRHPFTVSDEWYLSLLMIPLSFGSVSTSYGAAQFLIEQLQFPKQAVDLYMETAAITYNFQVLMSVAAVLTLILLTNFAFYKQLRIRWRSLITRLGFSLAFFSFIVFSAQITIPLKDNYHDLYENMSISTVIPNPISSELVGIGEGVSRNPERLPFLQILQSGVLKVGYESEEIPYCYFNKDHQLVGYDVAYAYQLARDLDCTLEFVPIDYRNLETELNQADFDLVMSSITMTEQRLSVMDFSNPYEIQDNVLVVPRSKRKKFINFKEVAETPGLTIAAGGASEQVARRHFPKATISTDIRMDPLMKGEVDAVLWSRSSAYVWCLNNPGYVTIDYGEALGQCYFAYPVRTGAYHLLSFLNQWLLLKKQSGFEKEMRDYWIEGLPPATAEPRWSILRNVFGVGKD